MTAEHEEAKNTISNLQTTFVYQPNERSVQG